MRICIERELTGGQSRPFEAGPISSRSHEAAAARTHAQREAFFRGSPRIFPMPQTAPLSVLAPFNRPHSVDGETADFLYALYQLLRNAPKSVGNHAKKRTFESAADSAHA